MEKEINQRNYEERSDEMNKERDIGKFVGGDIGKFEIDDKRAKSYIFLYFVFLVFFFVFLVVGIEMNNNGDDFWKIGSDPTIGKSLIKITNAEHLDGNRNFVENIFDVVNERDDFWGLINSGEYVRVFFESNLTNRNDISIYARSVSDLAGIEVYRENGDGLVSVFGGVGDEGWYRTYLSSLVEGESYDVFDLKVIKGDIEFDYIVDPSPLFGDADCDVGFVSDKLCMGNENG
tara:strand:- start:2603 stop:3301 length:699 start_codon:yes stop_codon:yes gene_type:complete